MKFVFIPSVVPEKQNYYFGFSKRIDDSCVSGMQNTDRLASIVKRGVKCAEVGHQGKVRDSFHNLVVNTIGNSCTVILPNIRHD